MQVTKCSSFMAHISATVQDEKEILTSGGRVLAVTGTLNIFGTELAAVTPMLKSSIDKAYQYVKRIQFDGVYYRKDIAQKGLSVTAESKSVTYKEAGVDIDT
jgi:phosphoribosylamine--glycine ligase/phosphoribosylformylglycinamidine cyclo-ligase